MRGTSHSDKVHQEEVNGYFISWDDDCGVGDQFDDENAYSDVQHSTTLISQPVMFQQRCKGCSNAGVSFLIDATENSLTKRAKNDHHKLHANISRFHRNNTNGTNGVNKAANGSKNATNPSSKTSVPPTGTGVNKGGNSYAKIVTGVWAKEADGVESSPVTVLDDECLVSKDISNSLFGRVKEFASLVNLKMTLTNEGFADVTIQYMGEFWVMIKFVSQEAIQKFRDNVSIGSWFSILKDATLDFHTDKRIAWVETEGIPFKLWTDNSFKRIAARWGELLSVDDQEDSCFHSKRLCVHTRYTRSISEDFKIIHRGKVHWIRAKETPGWVPDFEEENEEEDIDDANSNEDADRKGPNFYGDEDDIEEVQLNSIGDEVQEEVILEDGEIKTTKEKSDDPFGIYPLLNKNVKKEDSNDTESSLSHPPGFSHVEGHEHNQGQDGNNIYSEGDVIGLNKHNTVPIHMKPKDEATDSVSSGHFKKSEAPRSGGSILELLNDVVKVGQVMGYKMEGCMKNMAEIIEAQGVEEVNFLTLQETKMEKMDMFCIKKCWGNMAFDYVHSDAVGYQSHGDASFLPPVDVPVIEESWQFPSDGYAQTTRILHLLFVLQMLVQKTIFTQLQGRIGVSMTGVVNLSFVFERCGNKVKYVKAGTAQFLSISTKTKANALIGTFTYVQSCHPHVRKTNVLRVTTGKALETTSSNTNRVKGSSKSDTGARANEEKNTHSCLQIGGTIDMRLGADVLVFTGFWK
ncbi:nucleotide-binding alpha-beta plait domain-containing protein, partial [Tanacetum coccineum]